MEHKPNPLPQSESKGDEQFHSADSKDFNDDHNHGDPESENDDDEGLSELEILRKKNRQLSKKLKEVLLTVSTFQDQQRKLFHKFTDLKHDHSDLLDSTKKLLWEDILDAESGALKLDQIEKREEGLEESDSRVGDAILGEVLGEGQFAVVRACR